MAAAAILSRRSFLRAQLAAGPAALRPPWTSSERLAACTACGDCIAACPQAILSPGRDGLPVLSFAARECTFCGRCAEVCAEPVFTDRSEPAFRHLAAIGEACFTARGIHCQTCGDACPQAAIHFHLRLGGPPSPEIAAETCNGCGACLSACPAQAVTIRPREVAHD